MADPERDRLILKNRLDFFETQELTVDNVEGARLATDHLRKGVA